MNAELINFATRVGRAISKHDCAFDALALELFALQFQFNPAYRRISEVKGLTPGNIRHWTDVPFVPAAAFKELELSCIPAEERTDVFHSSGTTEQKPSRHFHCSESLTLYEKSLWRGFGDNVMGILHEPTGHSLSPDSPSPLPSPQGEGELSADCLKRRSRASVHGPNAFERKRTEAPHEPLPPLTVPNCRSQDAPYDVLILTPRAELAPHSSLVHMFEIVRQKLAAPETVFVGNLDASGAWNLNFDAALTALQAADKPKLILGTAYSFVHLLDFLAETNARLRLPDGSRVMETGGYKNRSRAMPKTELHSFITEFLGISREQIVCEYGMSELSSQAYDSGNGERHFHFLPWARPQIVSPETGSEVRDGETGLIRIFDLANVFSVAAIQTEDLAIRRGDGFDLIGRAALAEPRGCSLMTA